MLKQTAIHDRFLVIDIICVSSCYTVNSFSLVYILVVFFFFIFVVVFNSLIE